MEYLSSGYRNLFFMSSISQWRRGLILIGYIKIGYKMNQRSDLKGPLFGPPIDFQKFSVYPLSKTQYTPISLLFIRKVSKIAQKIGAPSAPQNYVKCYSFAKSWTLFKFITFYFFVEFQFKVFAQIALTHDELTVFLAERK